MKLIITLVLFIGCTYAAPLKNELLKRATVLDSRIKAEIKMLTNQKREHLAVLLQEEEKRLDTLTAELAKTTDAEQVKTAVLESQLITMEYRVENEISSLKRDSLSQQLLESSAKLLKGWVDEEIKILESTEGPHKSQAEEVARHLRKEEQKLQEIAKQLIGAQTQRAIEGLEVQLRALEVRLYEALRHLHFNPSTVSPSTGSTKPTIVQQSTSKSVAGVTFVTSKSTSLSPVELKNVLLKRATQLELSTKSEITKLHKQNRTAQVLVIQALDSEVIRISDRLKKTTQIELLELLDSELFWLESRLSIEIQSLQAQDKRVERLLAISGALKQRIVSALKLIANTPVGKALVGESKTLDALIVSLKNAKDDKKIDDMELQLTVVEKRVSDELRVMAVPTVKPF